VDKENIRIETFALTNDQYFYGSDASSTHCAECQSNLLALQKGGSILAMTPKHRNFKALTIAYAGCIKCHLCQDLEKRNTADSDVPFLPNTKARLNRP